jgi:Zn-dependent peptidase ImmA (M78 family)
MTLLQQDHAAQEPNHMNAAPPTRRHVIRRLRRLIPAHGEPMSWREAERVSRAQAALLTRLSDQAGTDIVDYVSHLPVVRVELDAALPDYCTSYWDAAAAQWVIIIRATDDLPQRRFSVLHEFKHILDRGHANDLYDPRYIHGLVQAGMAADQFANQSLMPARRLRALLREGATMATLARTFKVPTRRARERMSDLNLLPTIKHPERRESS